MERKYKCPVCSREHIEIEGLLKCVEGHRNDEIECARKQKEAQAQQLIQRNRELYNELIDNCTKLRTLGYDAVTSYSISPLREIRDERPKSRGLGKVTDDTKEKSTKRDGGCSIKREGLNIDKETENEINQLFSDFFTSLFN